MPEQHDPIRRSGPAGGEVAGLGFLAATQTC
jgi:hypothetical protein